MCFWWRMSNAYVIITTTELMVIATKALTGKINAAIDTTSKSMSKAIRIIITSLYGAIDAMQCTLWWIRALCFCNTALSSMT